MPAEGETVLRFLSDFNQTRGEAGEEDFPSLTFNSLQDYAGLVKKFDFTRVDLGAAKGLIDQLGQAASKQAFETVGHFVDRGLEVASGALGATGQWYGFAAGVLGEQFLDWAEGAFERSMGWDDLELIKVGEWVALNKGFTDQETRRRLFGAESGLDPITMEELHAEDHLVELHKRERVARNVQIGLTQGAPNNGYVQVFNTQTAQSENVRLEDVRKLDDREKRELDKDSVMGQLPGLLGATLLAPISVRGLRQVTDTGASKQPGDLVVCDSLLYVIKEARRDTVVVEANGYTKEARWDRLMPATNWTGSVGRGEYVWMKHHDPAGFMDDEYVLYCVHDVKGGAPTRGMASGGDEANIFSTVTGEGGNFPIKQLYRIGPNANFQGGIFGLFATAVAEGDITNIMKYRPGVNKSSFRICRQKNPAKRQIPLPSVGDEKTQTEVKLSQGNPTESYRSNLTANEARTQDALDRLTRAAFPPASGTMLMDWEPGEPGAPDDPAATPKGPYKTTYLIGAAVGAAVVVYVITR